MYLSKVEIKNFRCLKDVTVELHPGPNVLVGRNNAGKTNIFEAIRQAIGPAGARGEATGLERDDFYRTSAAAEAGVKEVLVPRDNQKEAEGLAPQILEKMKVTPVQSIEEVIAAALLPAPTP